METCLQKVCCKLFFFSNILLLDMYVMIFFLQSMFYRDLYKSKHFYQALNK